MLVSQTLSNFRHPNIAQLYGYSFGETSPQQSFYLIYELAEEGSLDTFWTSKYGSQRLSSFHRRLKIALDTFTAIRFLHVGNEDIGVRACFHRDIKSANIVLKRDLTAQLIDCGLAKFVKEDDTCVTTSTGVKGTAGYACPTYLLGAVEYEEKSDIFSFGIVLAEIWTGKLQNHKRVEPHQNGIKKKFNFYKEYIKRDRKMMEDMDPELSFDGKKIEALDTYARLTLDCLAEEPDDRPDGVDVMNGLKFILEQVEGVDLPISFRAIAPHGLCSRCRTYPAVANERICSLCTILEKLALTDDKLTNIHSTVLMTNNRLQGAMSILTRMDVKLLDSIPRLFVLLPGNRSRGVMDPMAWLRHKLEDTYHLYFVCAYSMQAVSAPIIIKKGKTWVKQAARLVGLSLTLLSMYGIPIFMPDANDESQLLQEHLDAMLEQVKLFIEEASSTPEEDLLLLHSLEKQQQVSPDQIARLNATAQEHLTVLAEKQSLWATKMVPVVINNCVQWVLKDVATSNNLAIVRV